jgi:hypothetical protein
LRNPWNVITRPLAENSQASPVAAVAEIRTDTDLPSASFIWEATVRIQISSYSRNSSPVSPV